MAELLGLIVKTLLLIVLFFVGFFHHKKKASLRKQKAKKLRLTHKAFLVLRVYNAVVMLFLLCIALSAIIGAVSVCKKIRIQFRGDPTDYTYCTSPIASKTSPDEAFDFTPKKPDPEPQSETSFETDPSTEDQLLNQAKSRLHIPQEYVDIPIGEMLEQLMLIIERIYTVNAPLDYTAPSDLLKNDMPSYLSNDQPYLRDAQKNYTDFQGTPELSTEYVYVNNLANACMTAEILNLPYPEMLYLLADTIHYHEDFLRYAPFTVDGNEISFEYLALVNGRVLLKNAALLENYDDAKPYVTYLLLESYCIFKRMAEITDKNNPWYLLFAYYSGNTAQNLLNRIDYVTNKVFCQALKKDALMWYRIAEDCLSSDTDYHTESGLEDRIRDGIADTEVMYDNLYTSVQQTIIP